jgi:hypothetical protein
MKDVVSTVVQLAVFRLISPPMVHRNKIPHFKLDIRVTSCFGRVPKVFISHSSSYTSRNSQNTTKNVDFQNLAKLVAFDICGWGLLRDLKSMRAARFELKLRWNEP